MQLFHTSIFSDQSPEVQEGWNFFKGSLEMTNPDGSTSLFGHIKSTIEERVTLYDGYLNNHHPHFLERDKRSNETSGHFLLTIVSDGFIDLSKDKIKSQGYVKIDPTRKKDKSLVLITLFLPKDEDFIITVKNPHDGKKRDILIGFIGLLGTLGVEDITEIIIKPTLTFKAVRFLKNVILKRCGIFGYF